jgi:hypothetical protein
VTAPKSSKTSAPTIQPVSAFKPPKYRVVRSNTLLILVALVLGLGPGSLPLAVAGVIYQRSEPKGQANGGPTLGLIPHGRNVQASSPALAVSPTSGYPALVASAHAENPGGGGQRTLADHQLVLPSPKPPGALERGLRDADTSAIYLEYEACLGRRRRTRQRRQAQLLLLGAHTGVERESLPGARK